MEDFGLRLKRLRKSRGLTQQQLADMIGCMKTTISNYETETSSPDKDSIIKISKALNYTTDELLGIGPVIINEGNTPGKVFADDIGLYKMPEVDIPVLGYIKAGEPLIAEQCIIDYIHLPQEYVGRGEFYALKVMGDSMNLSKIDDGDVVIVRRQQVVEDGDVAVVLIEGERATVKLFYSQDNIVTLVPNSSNKMNKPRCIDITKTPVRVLGKVVTAIVEI